ncbi:hypothetical protein OIU91_40290 [Streptomyces sp. NBC_01456]|uniref:hypothetical protein n=1 Tax=unclassified Streptomyces TaxID=2593676 RepID=UPI002E35D680|nr:MULTISPECIES: hypothetical protein [unclassified Streptomyces]
MSTRNSRPNKQTARERLRAEREQQTKTEKVPYSAEGMTALASFTFVRHIDGLRYTFARDGERNGRPAYRRTDGNVWCVRSPTDGWHCEIADGLVTAHPLNSHADEPEPPTTVWRSFKNDRSYLYDLQPLAPEA